MELTFLWWAAYCGRWGLSRHLGAVPLMVFCALGGWALFNSLHWDCRELCVSELCRSETSTRPWVLPSPRILGAQALWMSDPPHPEKNWGDWSLLRSVAWNALNQSSVKAWFGMGRDGQTAVLNQHGGVMESASALASAWVTEQFRLEGISWRLSVQPLTFVEEGKIPSLNLRW